MARSERSDKNHLKRIDEYHGHKIFQLQYAHTTTATKNIKFCLGEQRKRKNKGRMKSRNSEQATERAKFYYIFWREGEKVEESGTETKANPYY